MLSTVGEGAEPPAAATFCDSLDSVIVSIFT